MKLTLIRQIKQINTTFGILFLDGLFQCFTLEHTELIIPSGTYKLDEYSSPVNRMNVPLLLNVPNRTYIEIHIANYYNELKGCIAVGKSFRNDTLYDSKIAFDTLMSKLIFDDLSIEIRDWK